MKKIILLLPILFSISSVFAYTDCRDNINGCTNKYTQKVSNYLLSGCHRLKGTMWENMPKSVGSEMDLNFFLIKNGYLQATDKMFSVSGGEAPVVLWLRATTNAVKKFQSENGIKPTGAVGLKTLAKINSMICSVQTSSGCVTHKQTLSNTDNLYHDEVLNYPEGYTLDRCSLHTTPYPVSPSILVGCVPPQPGQKENLTCENGQWK